MGWNPVPNPSTAVLSPGDRGSLPSLSIGVPSHHWVNEGDGRTCFLDEMNLYTEGRAWALLAPMKSQPQWAVLPRLPEWASLEME